MGQVSSSQNPTAESINQAALGKTGRSPRPRRLRRFGAKRQSSNRVSHHHGNITNISSYVTFGTEQDMGPEEQRPQTSRSHVQILRKRKRCRVRSLGIRGPPVSVFQTVVPAVFIIWLRMKTLTGTVYIPVTIPQMTSRDGEAISAVCIPPPHNALC
ncbi:hypothetical protein NHX12_022381 [Muraenolepis orangiensis]|uniref:Uncharacterized protein n=1 Tax=Muraenolepis orangiensis TaxID=630683 RepID=A0A9Q0IU62_9TELE|nr:hypothetical protein NHX12_022381 [Muraenolepis orangiensis]